MKKVYVYVLSLVVMISLIGCETNKTDVPLGTSAISESEPSLAVSASSQAIHSNEQGNEQLNQFMEILSASLVLSESWDQADDLRVDAFPSFYYRMILLSQYQEGWDKVLQIPSKNFEDVITRYFDVSIEHLRTAENYDATEECYSFSYGIGSSGKLDIESVVESDNIVTVSYRQYNLGDNPIRDGVAKLKKDGEHYKILSCAIMEIN